MIKDRLTRVLTPTVMKIYLKLLTTDTIGAVCGSPTNCTIARAAKRQIRNLIYVKVMPNEMILSTEYMVYKFSISNKALESILMNDAGELVLDHDVIITSERIGEPRKKFMPTAAQKAKNAERHRQERAKGRYVYDNVRRMAAIRAGKKGKKVREAA